MEKAIEKVNTNPIDTELISSLVLNGDIGKMSDQMKVRYYNELCHSLNLNPVTRPFQLISFQGKSVLYATKDATEQLRKLNGVSVVDLTQEIKDGLCISKCKVQDNNGRFDIATGVVSIASLKGGDLANAIMKSETKSKRRATLSICGLGMLDESELDTMPKYETSDISKIKTEPSDFLHKVTAYLVTCKTKEELETAYDTAKSRDSYKSASDEGKASIDECYVNEIAKFVKVVTETEKFDPETEPAILSDILDVKELTPNELPEITSMKNCKTLTALNKIYKGITEASYFKSYADSYKKDLQDTYDAKFKELQTK